MPEGEQRLGSWPGQRVSALFLSLLQMSSTDSAFSSRSGSLCRSSDGAFVSGEESSSYGPTPGSTSDFEVSGPDRSNGSFSGSISLKGEDKVSSTKGSSFSSKRKSFVSDKMKDIDRGSIDLEKRKEEEESSFYTESGSDFIEPNTGKRKGDLPVLRAPGFRVIYGISFAVVVLLLFRFVPFSDAIFSEEYKTAQYCIGILLWALILWITRAFPLYVTSITIPILVVWERVLLEDEESEVDGVVMRRPMERDSATDALIAQMFSSPVLFVMAACLLSIALRHYKIDSFLVSSALDRVVKRGPNAYLCVLLILGYIFSALTTNFNAFHLLINSSRKHFENLPDTKAGKRLRSLILTAIVICTNVGGMSTPIASPQSAILLYISQLYGYNITFTNFLCVSLLTSFVLTIVGFYFVRGTYYRGKIEEFPSELYNNEVEVNQVNEILQGITNAREYMNINEGESDHNDNNGKIHKHHDHKVKQTGDKNTKKCCKCRKNKQKQRKSVSTGFYRRSTIVDAEEIRKRDEIFKTPAIVSIVFVILSIIYLIVSGSSDTIKAATGGTETASIITICIMLIVALNVKTRSNSNKNHLNSIPWPIIMLLMCGNLLIYSMRQSGLLGMIGDGFHNMLGNDVRYDEEGNEICNMGVSYGILILYLVIFLIVGSIASHTISALILLPMIAEFGLPSHEPHACFNTEVYLILSTLMCSGTAILPTSSFPNVAMNAIVDQFGNPYLKPKNVISIGIIDAVFNLVLISSLGFGLALVLYK